MEDFTQFCTSWRPQINRYLHEQISREVKQAELREGMLYSLDAGGKRLRPLLALATLKTFQAQVDLKPYLRIFGAIELIHTYSLIHDDLPEMDNDDYRRGKLTNHKYFSVGRAVLAGDALLTQAFFWLSDNNLDSSLKSALIQTLSQAAGPQGMVAGQMLDIINTGRTLDYPVIRQLDAQKTGALLQASVLMGALCAQANSSQRQHLQQFAGSYGIAFQIYDDLLDLQSTSQAMGKAVGKDAVAGKNTYPQLLGISQAQKKLQELIREAQRQLQALQLDTSLLDSSLDYFKQE
ncbi:polyprenyl synthetase family protein [Lactobacillus sp. DCY120]|uniref:Farnesyl diphosphate synthase n=1 Tax=Bombilactobacillus apium TaxID=2675299 RepID=A0A850R7Y2_9LACO|nr:farnesyl diphosphate synthase [Bombilactobacillus apium]NVY96957.1 polyprenyl synthetase family protein [Bombilactobacillus apium]